MSRWKELFKKTSDTEQTEEKTFDKDLFESITQTITIYKDGRVMFTLKNGVNVTEMLP